MTDEREFASPPCMAADVDPQYFDPHGKVSQTASDVARWRRAERRRLASLRNKLDKASQADVSSNIARHLEAALDREGLQAGERISVYWPIASEPDLRPLMHSLHARGVVVLLPVVKVKDAPLVFRPWTPDTVLETNGRRIPVPPVSAGEQPPQWMVAPCLGWDREGYRLGWGGGYFDRSLAVADPPPRTFGVALSAAQLPSIYPLPHDIPLDVIVTEMGEEARREL